MYVCGWVGIDGRAGVFVIAATNRPEMIDRAMLRPGRLDKLIMVPLPVQEERLAILRTLVRGKPVGPEGLDLETVVKKADYFRYDDAWPCVFPSRLCCTPPWERVGGSPLQIVSVAACAVISSNRLRCLVLQWCGFVSAGARGGSARAGEWGTVHHHAGFPERLREGSPVCVRQGTPIVCVRGGMGCCSWLDAARQRQLSGADGHVFLGVCVCVCRMWSITNSWRTR